MYKTRKFNNRKRTNGRNYKFVSVTVTEKVGRKKIQRTEVRRIVIESRDNQFMNKMYKYKYGRIR
ncbi:MAG: hypothetical protein RBT49_10685 [Bacteroidales bacterium]|jgi:hypothetical protein|nr:hypothetical protein [Bacteroidales bacterium]